MAQDYSLTHAYIPKADTRNRNLFKEEYYSGTDCVIKIDGEEQTEIAYIAYNVQEQLLPIYGYASRTFDTVAVGNRIISGQLRITIKNPEQQVGDNIGEALNEWSESAYTAPKDNNSISSVDAYNEIEKARKNWDESISVKNNTTFGNIVDSGSSNSSSSESESSSDTYDKDAYARKISEINGVKLNDQYNLTDKQIKKLIRQFQKNYLLEQTGELDKNTVDKINEVYAQKMKEKESSSTSNNDQDNINNATTSGSGTTYDPTASSLPVYTPLYASPEDTEPITYVVNKYTKYSSNPVTNNSDWICVTNNSNGKKYYVKTSSIKTYKYHINSVLAFATAGGKTTSVTDLHQNDIIRISEGPIHVTGGENYNEYNDMYNNYYRITWGDGRSAWIDGGTYNGIINYNK